jgi:hypothetical protein
MSRCEYILSAQIFIVRECATHHLVVVLVLLIQFLGNLQNLVVEIAITAINLS